VAKSARKVPYAILVADYASGLSQEQVGIKRGVSSTVVHQALKLAKYSARPIDPPKGPANPRWRGGCAGYYQRNKNEILAKAKLKTESKRQYDRQRYLDNQEQRITQSKDYYRSQDPAVLREKARQKHLLRRYGLTIEGYNELVNKQNGVCAICAMPPRGKKKENSLHVDHDHATKAVRGLLCLRCNLHLAWMELFEAEAKAYLARAAANPSPKRGAGFVRPKQAKRAPHAEDWPNTITMKKSYRRVGR